MCIFEEFIKQASEYKFNLLNKNNLLFLISLMTLMTYNDLIQENRVEKIY